jgi:MFS family permease
MTVVWAGLTIACAGCTHYSQLAAVRFLQGIAEASTYSGTQYIIGSWYKGSEAGKRIGLFQASGMVGTMFAGMFWNRLSGSKADMAHRHHDDCYLEYHGWRCWPSWLEMGKQP